MESILAELPHTFLGWVSMLFSIAFLVLVLIRQTKSNDLKVLTESNKALRDLVGDLRNEVDSLKRDTTELHKLNEENKKEIDDLKSKRKDLEELIVMSLKMYFEANPERAKKALKDIDGKALSFVK